MLSFFKKTFTDTTDD
jgi:hypothetical protein